MLLSVTEAAKVAGCARSTIYEKINNGQLSRSAGGKIDTAELQRVFGELQTPPTQQSNSNPDTPLQTQPDIVLSAELLDMVQAKDSELNELRAELDDTRKRLTEHREAARALIDPETFEAKQAQWQQALAERKQQTEQARAEADALRQQQHQSEQKMKAMQNRGLIDRLLNREPVSG